MRTLCMQHLFRQPPSVFATHGQSAPSSPRPAAPTSRSPGAVIQHASIPLREGVLQTRLRSSHTRQHAQLLELLGELRLDIASLVDRDRLPGGSRGHVGWRGREGLVGGD